MTTARAPEHDPTSSTGGFGARVGTTVLGKWRIDALIGVGGMAAVYAATHLNGRRAALKILHPEYSRDPTIRDRFLREGYVANKVQHPGRVDVFDHDVTEDGAHFLIMELLSGETLDAMWRRCPERRMGIVEALTVMEQLLDFLSVCHSVGVVHRDLKPANVFVTNEGRVKVLDFGIAQLRDATNLEHTRAGTTLGTPAYMSPEQARGLGDKLDGRADIFSVGAILYGLLSGSRLHRGRSNDEALIMAATQPAPSLARAAADLPVEVIALVDKALAWDRRNRCPDAQAMRSEVLAVLARLREEPGGGAQPATDAQGGAERAPEIDDDADRKAPGRVADGRSAPVEAPRPSAGDPAGGPAADDDALVVRLRAVFRHLERLVPVVRQYGRAHPETDRKRHAFFAEIVEALRTHGAIGWTVRPYSFMWRGREVWEPPAPLDAIPWTLFESGVRALHIVPGVSEDELRQLVEVMLLDPGVDLPPEDDLATVLWDLALTHVRVEVADAFAEGGAAQREAFWAESDELELAAADAARTARVEARAMAIATEGEAHHSGRRDDAHADDGAGLVAAAAAIDPTARLALAAQLTLSSERWRERWTDIIVEAWREARRGGDAPVLAAALARSSLDLLLGGQIARLLEIYRTLLRALERTPGSTEDALVEEMTTALLGAEVLPTMVSVLDDPGVAAEARTLVSELLAAALTHLAATELPRLLGVLTAARTDTLGAIAVLADQRVRVAITEFLGRVAPGREQALVAGLTSSSPMSSAIDAPIEVAHLLLGVLAQVGTPAALRAIDDVASAGNLVLRLEALGARAVAARLAEENGDEGPPSASGWPPGGTSRAEELTKLADHPDYDVRLAALRAIAQHRAKEVGPALVRRIEDPGFDQLTGDERRELLHTLHLLNPARAETVAIELLSQRGVLKGEAREHSRVVAANFLGEVGRSSEALEAAQVATRGWWGTTDELKNAAAAAAGAIEERMKRASTPDRGNPR